MQSVRFILIALALTAAAPAVAAPITAAGDGRNLWLIAPPGSSPGSSPGDSPGSSSSGTEAAPVITVLHRAEGDDVNTVSVVTSLKGSIIPGGAAAAASRVYIVYDDGTVQWIAHTPPTSRYMQRYGDATVAGRLPDGTTLAALGADQRGPWALVQVETPAALAAIDAPPEVAEGATSETAATEAPAAPVLPVDRLIRRVAGQWRNVALPDAWSHGTRAWIVTLDVGADRPYLVSLARPDVLTVYAPSGDDAWTATDYPIADAGADRLHVLAVGGQLIVARGADGNAPAAAVSLLRDGKTLHLGELRMQGAAGPWTLAAMASSVVMIVDRAAGGGADTGPARTPDLVWQALDLQGRLTHETTLAVEKTTPIEQAPGRLMVVAALSCAMLLMFGAWRSSPVLSKLKLPKNTAVADLSRRATAAMIDLVPGVAIVALFYPAVREDWTALWIGSALEWSDMTPGIIGLAVTALHTTIGEMFFARTIGKAMTGLRVIATTGGPINIWQAITRNVMRTFDLVAWYVLPILMILSPYRQRLGDMLAKTIVIVEVPPEDDQ